jgi:hypothetical protein
MNITPLATRRATVDKIPVIFFANEVGNRAFFPTKRLFDNVCLIIQYTITP